MAAEVARVRAVAVRGRLPGPAVWVVLRRSLAEPRELKAYLPNAPADIPLATLVWLPGMRWPVEQAGEEAKDELGRDHHEVRGWRGWHHHATMTLLAQHFLVRLRCRVGGEAPALTVPRARLLLAATLPARRRDAPALLRLVHAIQRRSYAAACAHRQRVLQRLPDPS